MADVHDNETVVTLEDTGDGTGDVFVPIPDEIMERLGWDENTELNVSVNDAGTIVISPAKD